MLSTVTRLITQFVPTLYTLSLNLERQERAFTGTLTITGQSLSTDKTIRLHSKDLLIHSVTLDGKQTTWANESDELIITHPDLIQANHILVIRYTGTITDAMHGLYPCYYEDDGVKKELLATQFESHHAREVFPCIDEPEAKAEFDVTLTTEQSITVLGNMPIKWQRIEDNRLVTTFERTPRMSTYLVAWVTGALHRKTAQTTRGIDVNVWATPAQTPESLDFALESAVRSIDFYENYFGVEYPLPKSDHVALPDFSSGAMENWGLITYREVALLADPATTSISSKQYIATVVAHELAHQWFGNLVTMRWWNNLWLNESFASMMEYLATDYLYPEWNMWLEFSTNESIMALRRDSIDGVQAVQVDVHHPDEISTLFDGAIVYAKGARLLRMLQRYIGDEAFQAGLKQYFIAHAYQNTEADDLWHAMAHSSGKDIVQLMNTWISQPGYPVVRVEQTNTALALSQTQFFVGPHQPSTRIWPIPLNASSKDIPALLETREITTTYHGSSTPLRLNVGDSAHFITHYSPELFARLIEEVKTGSASRLDRLQLLHEATLLARGGVLPSVQLLELISAYRHETSEPVWSVLFIALSELRKFVETDELAEKKLRKFSASIARPQYKRLGWVARPHESEEDAKLRGTILSLTLYGEDPAAIQTAQGLYESHTLETLDAELRPLIISTVARYGDETVVDQLLERYLTTQSSELRQDICIGITSTPIPKKIDELLAAIKNSEIIRPQDAAHWFVYLIRGRESRDKAWQWIRDNWQWVIDTFEGDKSYDDYPRYSAAALSTAQQLQEYIDFFTPKKELAALTRVITIGVSEIEGRVELIGRDGPAVRTALRKL